jgi:tRNA (cytidine/uridine-2'-O-)-methyltransferase
LIRGSHLSHLIELAAYEPDFAPNLGSLVRLGVCFDTPLKLLKSRGLDYVDKAVIHRHDSWQKFKSKALIKTNRLVLMSTKSSKSIWDFNFQAKDCIILGRESAGVPEYIHEEVHERVYIPMPGNGRSLNIAISAAIALAEASRQLREKF